MMPDIFRQTLNEWGCRGIPFLFIIDFEQKKPRAWKLADIQPQELLYHFNGKTNEQSPHVRPLTLALKPTPAEPNVYESKFTKVMAHLERGDSFLLNLSMRTPTYLNRPLVDYYYGSTARYKLWWKDHFVLFSPEVFVRTVGSRIYSHPMKGTIDASIAQAEELILANAKEKAEHVTIVDLIRNDLSRVAENVNVTRFRYIERIKTHATVLLQVSSEIEAVLRPAFHRNMGDLLAELLPAGSVSGAPKDRTCQIISEVEGEDRGYYTGVCGIFDGENLDSGVMIRFIEQRPDGYYFRSGGGVTTQSICANEWDEIQKKIYVPVH